MSTAQTRRGLWAWVVYDWGSNAFATVIQTFVFATFFARAVAPNPTQGQSWWSWAMAGAAIGVAVIAPFMGAAVDGSARRKPWIFGATLVCVMAMMAMWWVRPEPGSVTLALALGVIGTLGAELALVPYNALLADMVPRDRLGRWSGIGWAAGYLGGLACLVIVLVLFTLDGAPVRVWLGDDASQHLRGAFVFCGLWYLVFALPMLWWTTDAPRVRAVDKPQESTWRRTLNGLARLRHQPNILRFLIARLLYTDGMATLFALGAVYASGVFGMGETRVLLFGIVITGTAGLGAIAFAWIDDWIGGKRTVLLALIGLTIGCAGSLLAPSELWLWVSAVMVGIFVGPAQAASRSLMARLAPEDERGELFGLFAFSGKVMAFLGPAAVGTVTALSGSQRWGMSTILVFLIAGAVLLLGVREERAA